MTAIVGAGTSEETWSGWLADQPWPTLDLAAVHGRRVMVLAAHPDDEVLGVGGLMVALAALHHKLVLVWASDGEASHPGSNALTRADLARRRREESTRALARLGVEPVATHHLGLPDGQLVDHHVELRDRLSQIVCPGDVVIAPWCSDGHPDHDAVGAAAVFEATTTWYYPIWMWHWSRPDDPAVPWRDFRSIKVPDPVTKAAAISEFVTQVQPIGPLAEDAPILPPHVLARFRRSVEWVVT